MSGFPSSIRQDQSLKEKEKKEFRAERFEKRTEKLAGLANAVGRPLEIEGELEKLLPEIGGDWEGLLADKGSDQVLRCVLRSRAAPARGRRHGPHWSRSER